MCPGGDANRSESTTLVRTQGLGKQLEGMGLVTECKRTKTNPNSFLFTMVQLKKLAFYLPDAQDSKQCISLTLTDTPHHPSPFLKLERRTADMTTKMYRAHGINTMVYLVVNVLATGKYGKQESI